MILIHLGKKYIVTKYQYLQVKTKSNYNSNFILCNRMETKTKHFYKQKQ